MAPAMLFKPMSEKNGPLTNDEIVSFFKSCEHIEINPFRPKGGQILVFKPKSSTQKDDWRADGHRWSNGSTKKLPRKDPIYKKSYFYAKGEEGKPVTGFRKDVYFPLENPDHLAVVHYIGNEELSLVGKHGNCLKQTKLFFRTKPSVLKRIADEVQDDVPHKVYKNLITEQHDHPINEATDRPRNVKQLSNMKATKCAEQRISRDAVLNLHEIAFEENGFIWHITTYSALVVICGLKEMVNLLSETISWNRSEIRKKPRVGDEDLKPEQQYTEQTQTKHAEQSEITEQTDTKITEQRDLTERAEQTKSTEQPGNGTAEQVLLNTSGLNSSFLRDLSYSGEVWIPADGMIIKENLNVSDRDLITSPFGWLNGTLIDASMDLIRHQFGKLKGLQSCCLAIQFDLTRHSDPFIQIINRSPTNGGNHWLTATNIGCDTGINICDSSFDDVPELEAQAVSTLIRLEGDYLHLNILDVFPQNNSYDCGLYAIANMVSLAYGKYPTAQRYDRKKLRSHLCSNYFLLLQFER